MFHHIVINFILFRSTISLVVLLNDLRGSLSAVKHISPVQDGFRHILAALEAVNASGSTVALATRFVRPVGLTLAVLHFLREPSNLFVGVSLLLFVVLTLALPAEVFAVATVGTTASSTSIPHIHLGVKREGGEFHGLAARFRR